MKTSIISVKHESKFIGRIWLMHVNLLVKNNSCVPNSAASSIYHVDGTDSLEEFFQVETICIIFVTLTSSRCAILDS